MQLPCWNSSHSLSCNEQVENRAAYQICPVIDLRELVAAENECTTDTYRGTQLELILGNGGHTCLAAPCVIYALWVSLESATD